MHPSPTHNPTSSRWKRTTDFGSVSGWMALLLVLPWAASAAGFDTVIRHGRVADGTGNPAYFADVGIRDGRIALVGTIAEPGRVELDASGCVVAPGFVDVHTHAENIEALPAAENFLRMGVTTLVLGNCGASELQVPEFFARLESQGMSANVATLLGHGTLRSHVMGGSFMRPPTDEELERMRSLVRQGMEAGALGLSTGLIYLPGTFAKTEELVELAKVAAAYDGIYVSHMRDEGDGIMAALEELFRIAREGRIRAEVSHIKLSGKPNWGRAEAVLAAIDRVRGEGLDITQDMYLYPASSTGLSQLIPAEAREGGRFAERLADPVEKARIIAAMKKRLERGDRDSYDYAMIAAYRKNPALNGLNVVEAARAQRGSDTLEDQIELILEIEAAGGASGVFHGMSEEDLRRFLVHPNTMIGADSSVRPFGEGVPHPRGYGNAARMLGHYTRDECILRLEDAVRRMTSLPAQTFRLPDRGQIREGAWADVAVFDPATVRDRATFSEPHQYAEGFRWVLVNGVVVVDHDRHLKVQPGRIVRRAGTPDPSAAP